MNSLKKLLLGEQGLVVIFAAAFVIVSLFVPNFLTERNMLGLLQSVVTIGIVACTMMFCLASRDFDLSVGSTVAFSGMIAVMASNATGSIILGLLSALHLWRLRRPGQRRHHRPLPHQCADHHAGDHADRSRPGADRVRWPRRRHQRSCLLPACPVESSSTVPTPIWVMGLLFIFFGFRAQSHRLRQEHAGDRRQSGGLAACWRQCRQHAHLDLHALQGLVCGIAGILLASRITSGQPNAATGLELSVISACVLGGVSLAGGRAAMSGVIVGVLIMGIAENVMNLLNIQAFYQYVVRGLILLVAVLLDNLRSVAAGRRR
jgi:L-arabinose transport system permease protein